MLRRFLITFPVALFVLILAASEASAAVFLYSNFKIHDFDQSILQTLNFDSGSVTYLRELGSVNSQQMKEREQYEEVGCYPFILVRNGATVETGYNCQTFFCVGYKVGPRVCKDLAGKAYGGVVEIQNRLNTILVLTEQTSFASFPEADHSEYMKKRIKDLKGLRCEPFYDMLFDSAVGEGFYCEEIGQYPYFSSEHTCRIDWRFDTEQTCDVELRANEEEIRAQAMEYREEELPEEEESDDIDQEGSPSEVTVSFPDVIAGHYGYTAITDLARRGIAKGYADGTFQPYGTLNRAEFAKLLLGGLHPELLKGESNCFPDVLNEWFADYVCAAKRLGWIKGYPNGTFAPEQTIKKSEAIKIIIASMGMPLDSTAPLPKGVRDDQWYTPFVRKAMELGLLLEPSFLPESDVMRADASVWIYRSLKAMGR